MERSQRARPTETIIAIGNPGVGKSTVGNCLAGSPVFEAGPSRSGAGVTTKSLAKMAGIYWFVDTPGLADAATRAEAAEQITLALKKDQTNVKVIFFFSLIQEGRLQDQDKVTLQLTLKAISKEVGKDRFGILFSRVDSDWYDTFKNDKSDQADFDDILWAGIPEEQRTRHKFFNVSDPDLKGKKNHVKPLPQELRNWIETLPTVNIAAKNVDKVEGKGYQQILQTAEQARQAAEAANRARREAEEARAEADKAREKAEKERDEARKQQAKLSGALMGAAFGGILGPLGAALGAGIGAIVDANS